MELNLVAVEGNNGSEIKKFLNFLSQNFQVNVTLNYTLNQYSNICEENKRLMKLSLRDSHRWTFTTLVKYLMDKYEYLLKLKCNNSYLFTNKSYLSDIECLSKTYYDLKYITPEEYDIFKHMSSLLKFPKYTHIIYLKSDPNICYERLIEKKHLLDFEFLHTLHQNYEHWIETLRKKKKYIFIIDINDLNDNNEIIKDQLIKKLTLFFKTLEKNKYNDDNMEWTVVKKNKKKK